MPAKATGATRIHHTAYLSSVIDQLCAACAEHGRGQITVQEILNRIGRRSFGPVLLVLGLIGVSPVSNIPGVVAVLATIDILVAGELLIGMDHVWIPGFIARRSMNAAKVKRLLEKMRRTAGGIDGLLRPRLTFLTQGPFYYALAATCLVVALALPVIELIPLAGVIPNAALVALALAMTAHDGLWALIALGFTATSGYFTALALMQVL
jgi:hypothetical protein